MKEMKEMNEDEINFAYIVGISNPIIFEGVDKCYDESPYFGMFDYIIKGNYLGHKDQND
jgi:hypothetical protein